MTQHIYEFWKNDKLLCAHKHFAYVLYDLVYNIHTDMSRQTQFQPQPILTHYKIKTMLELSNNVLINTLYPMILNNTLVFIIDNFEQACAGGFNENNIGVLLEQMDYSTDHSHWIFKSLTSSIKKYWGQINVYIHNMNYYLANVNGSTSACASTSTCTNVSNLTVSGNLHVGNDLHVRGNLYVGGDLHVRGNLCVGNVSLTDVNMSNVSLGNENMGNVSLANVNLASINLPNINLSNINSANTLTIAPVAITQTIEPVLITNTTSIPISIPTSTSTTATNPNEIASTPALTDIITYTKTPNTNVTITDASTPINPPINPPINEEEITKINYEKRMLKKMNDKIEQEKSVFNSEKEYTYPKIYKIFSDDKGNFENIPQMFLNKFIVFLYMEGKDSMCNQIRTNILSKNDSFPIYKLLYSALTEENFTIPENCEHVEYLELFINQIPQIDIETEPQTVFSSDESIKQIFSNDICDQDSHSDSE